MVVILVQGFVGCVLWESCKEFVFVNGVVCSVEGQVVNFVGFGVGLVEGVLVWVLGQVVGVGDVGGYFGEVVVVDMMVQVCFGCLGIVDCVDLVVFLGVGFVVVEVLFCVVKGSWCDLCVCIVGGVQLLQFIVLCYCQKFGVG